MKKLIIIIFFIALYPILCLADDILWQKTMEASAFEFHPNGNYLAVAYGGGLSLRNIQTGAEIQNIKEIKNDGPLAMNFSKDGKYLACGSGSGRIWVWDTETWKERVIDELPGGSYDSPGISSIEFSPDGSILAAAASTYGMVLYDTKTWERIDRWRGFPEMPKGSGLMAEVTNVSFRFDSKVLAITSNQANKVFLYEINTKQSIDSLVGASAKYSPIRNELILIKMIYSNGNFIADGLNYYKFDISNQPEHLSLLIDGFNLSNDGNYIIRYGTIGNVYITRIQNLLENYSFTGHINAKLDKSQRYLATISGYIYMIDLGTILGVIEPELIENFNLFPNPATDFIEISIGANGRSSLQSDVRIYNVLGEIQSTPVCSADTPASGGQRINISGLAPGVYFVRIGDRVSKFVKI